MHHLSSHAVSRSDANRSLSTDHSDSRATRNRFSSGEKIATLAVLLTGLALTALVFKWVNDTYQDRAIVRFEQEASDATNLLSSTLRQHTNLLLALQGFFHASDDVTRLTFRRFVESLDTSNLFPGATGLSWNELVHADEIERFVAEVRADNSLVDGGYPDFNVSSVVDGEDPIVVKYIEPMTGNENAFGFNIASNAERRTAVEKARDTGSLVLSAPITLVQETGSQKGYLMMLPTYEPMSPATLTERRQAFFGMAVLVFRVGDLVAASLMPNFTFLQIRDVTDNNVPLDVQLVYDEGEFQSTGDHLQSTRELTVGSRSWLLTFQKSHEQRAVSEHGIAIVVASLGVLVSLLAASLIGALTSSRRRALSQAQALTVGLHKANEELSRSNADLSQFAHVASHDLQTPVRNVISAVTLLEEHLGHDIDAEAKEYLEFLRKSSNRMRALVSDLLEYARLGRDAINVDPVDLDELLVEVLESTKELATNYGADIQVGKLPRVLGDARQLQRVFENLITNAIKYANPDRKPRIAVQHQTETHQRNPGRSSKPDNAVHITISDNGQGIEEVFREKVFLPFQRLHRHDDIPGSGLGLGICKQIIERHGGALVIESSSDQGTTFLISLPERIAR